MAMEQEQKPFDVILRGGRVIDAETGLDDVRDVAIRDGRIVAVCTPPLAAAAGGGARGRPTEEIDCRGLVVSPGFVDMHSHAVNREGAQYQACDGVTTHLELEFGAWPVDAYYEAREGGAVIHYGASVGHIPARVATLDAPSAPRVEACCVEPHLLSQCVCASSSTNLQPTGARGEPVASDAAGAATASKSEATASADLVVDLRRRLEEGLAQGGMGIGVGIQYTPGANHAEIYRVFQTAAAFGVPCFVHCRGTYRDVSDFHELFANAAATGAQLQICHIAASCAMTVDLGLVLEMMEDLHERGVADITAEQYPYCAGMTRIDSPVFNAGWRDRLGIGPESLEWCETGERLTEDGFRACRERGGNVIAHNTTEGSTDLAISHPRVAIASDAIPWDNGGRSHPRSAGCFCRVLGHYVRERRVLSLREGLRKMTLLPAQVLQSFCPAMRKKGRVQVGCDADITVFDAATVADRSTYAEPAKVSTGVVHVLVAGTFVVRDGVFREGVFPGRAVRSDVTRRDDARHRHVGGICPETARLEKVLPDARGLVFDCDGTLLDTMPLYYESWKRACDEVGLDFPLERFYAYAGRTVPDIFQTLIDEQLGHQELVGGKTAITAEYCESVKRRHHADIEAEGRNAGPIDVVVDIAFRYHGKLPMAVASSGWRDHVLSGLERIGVLHLFDAVVTACDDAVQRPKPAPDIFLVAAERIGVCPSKCVGFEDADLGMKALKDAGYLYASDVRLLHMYPRNVENRRQSSNFDS